MKFFDEILKDEENLKRKSNYMYGVYKRFNIVANIINVAQAVSTLVIKISVKSDSEESKNKINEYFKNLDKNKSGITFTKVNDFFCEIHISNGFKGKIVKQTNEFLTNFIDFLNRENFENGCNICGLSDNIETYKINESYSILCNNCISKIEQESEERTAAIAGQKSNIIPGIIGAVLGSLIGVLAWVIIYKVGYIASIAGLITVIFAIKGYEKFGKYLDKKGVVISLIISVIMIYIANQMSWTLEIISSFNESGLQMPFFNTFLNLLDILKELEIILGDNSIIMSFYKDLIIGYLLSLIAIIPYVKEILKSVKNNITITKLD